MKFTNISVIEKLGHNAGFVFSYFLFTAVLFFFLRMMKVIPNSWAFYHIMLATLGFVITGILIKKIIL